MKTTPDFISDLKAKYGLKSNYAVAKFLGQTDTAVARWSHGKGSFSDETAMQFADLLDIDPVYIVACMHAERAKREEEKKLWERIASLAAGVAALLVIAALPWDNSGAFLLAGFTSGAPGLYIMSNDLALYWPLCTMLLIALLAAFPRYGTHSKK